LLMSGCKGIPTVNLAEIRHLGVRQIREMRWQTAAMQALMSR